MLYLLVGISEGGVPLLIGLDLNCRNGLVLCFYKSPVYSKKYKCILHIEYFRKHEFITLNKVSVSYSKHELTPLYLHFFHPWAEQLILYCVDATALKLFQKFKNCLKMLLQRALKVKK